MPNRDLHVITCISNPVRYKTRYDLYRKFAKYIEGSGAVLYTAEMAFGDRPHEITQSDNLRHLQLRSRDELWHKENMLNLMIQRLPHDWQFVAFIDADVMFNRPDWLEETVEQLQHYDFVQMFSHAIDLSPTFEPMKTHTGFVHDWYHGAIAKDSRGYDLPGHPGYAWAATRRAIDSVGGLIDHGILGSGDRHMADALIGKIDRSYNANVHENYKKICQEWQNRAEKHIRRNIGYVSGTLVHAYHGSKQNRAYNDRWKILVNHQFDPMTDVYRDSQGLWKLNDNKVGLRDDIRRYFRNRQEDCIYTGEYKLIS